MASVVALIVAVTGTSATAEIDRRSLCRRCAEGRGCGALTFGAHSRRRMVVDVPATLTLCPGDRVLLSMSDTNLLRAALYGYGLPLAGFLSMPLLANRIPGGLPDMLLATLAIGGLLSGVLAGRSFLQRRGVADLVPVLAGRADPE